ncbi:MAG: hypothetical protein KIT09_08295 [Bryobacteraceae bacterium]|nr:hypothetical protein [Bryobacteraceae bacterium]
MFFRRAKPRQYSFAERLEMVKQGGFAVQDLDSRQAVAVRSGCAALIEDGDKPRIVRAGWLVGREIGELVDLGYQKEWRAASGAREPALANQLKSLHAFLEDLRETLGLASYYNESLGTVNDSHLYDRVEGRESGAPKTLLSPAGRAH